MLLIGVIALSSCSLFGGNGGSTGAPGLGMAPRGGHKEDRRVDPTPGAGDDRHDGDNQRAEPPGPATSANATRICIRYEPKYADADEISAKGIEAYGLEVSVRAKDGKEAWRGHVSDKDGCSPEFQADESVVYTVTATSTAEIHGNTITLKVQDGDRLTHDWDVSFTKGKAKVVGIPNAPMVRILAAMSLGFERESDGITGKTIQIFQKVTPGAKPCPGTSCNQGGSIFYLGTTDGGDQTDVLNTMLHELGHKIMSIRTGLDPDEIKRNDAAPPSGKCKGGDGHRRDSVEWHSLAIIEGVAHFYASAVLNPGADAACLSFSHYGMDWNHDGNMDGKPYRCDGPPVQGLGLSAGDYMGDQCGPRFLPGTANEYDYQRFFWDLHHNSHLTVNQIWDVIGAANRPTPWNAKYEPGSSANPKDRMQAAADKMGFGPAWSKAAKANGVDR